MYVDDLSGRIGMSGMCPVSRRGDLSSVLTPGKGGSAMGPSASQMVAAAKARIENLSPDRVAAELEAGSVLLVDIREEHELAATGSIVPSIHAPRGLLEFYADPSSPTHLEAMDPGRRII